MNPNRIILTAVARVVNPFKSATEYTESMEGSGGRRSDCPYLLPSTFYLLPTFCSGLSRREPV